jgi:16S rRNA (guanine527-N7)-methyltransferase
VWNDDLGVEGAREGRVSAEWRSGVRAEAALVGVAVTEQCARVLGALCMCVAEAPFRATGTRDLIVLRRKHVVDSLACLPVARLSSGERVVDLGSGAGFPGLVLAAVRPDITVELVDSQVKKARFLDTTATRLGLTNVRVIQERAEQLLDRRGWKGACDCVVARALAPLPRLLELALPLCRVHGRVIALKGPNAPQEVAAAGPILVRFGARESGRLELELPGGAERRVILRFDKEPRFGGRWGSGRPADSV